jgi:hypothetical protein
VLLTWRLCDEPLTVQSRSLGAKESTLPRMLILTCQTNTQVMSSQYNKVNWSLFPGCKDLYPLHFIIKVISYLSFLFNLLIPILTLFSVRITLTYYPYFLLFKELVSVIYIYLIFSIINRFLENNNRY